MKFRRLVKALLKRDLATINKNLSRKGLYEFLEEQFALIEKGETVLSIGAGGGVNRLLKTYQKGDLFSVVETDIDESRGPDIVADLCDPNISIQQGPFSTIVCSEVLEHCYDPFQAIKNMHGLLEKNGRLVLTTPFLFPLHEEPIDFFRYTKHGLLHLTRDFSDVKVKQSNRYGDAFLVFLVRYGGFGKFGAWATTILAYCLLPFGWLLNRGASNRFGTTRYLVVATR